MFAGLLNKGIRGSLALLILTLLSGVLLNLLAEKSLELDLYPNLFYNYFTHNITSKPLIALVNLAFLGLGASLVSLIAVEQEIVDKQNHFPVFIYLLLGIACISPLQISSQAFTNVFILFALYRLLDIYRKDQVLGQIFEAAFLLSVSAFITISSVLSFPLFFIALLILRPFYWREWAVALLGFFTPVFIYECVAYLSDFNQWYITNATVQYFTALKVPGFSEFYLPLSFFLFLLLVLSLLAGLMGGFGNTVKKQRMRSVLLWYLLLSVFAFFAGGANSSGLILTYAIPVCYFVGDFLFDMRQLKFSNTLLSLLIFCVAIVFLGKLDVF